MFLLTLSSHTLVSSFFITLNTWLKLHISLHESLARSQSSMSSINKSRTVSLPAKLELQNIPARLSSLVIFLLSSTSMSLIDSLTLLKKNRDLITNKLPETGVLSSEFCQTPNEILSRDELVFVLLMLMLVASPSTQTG